MFSALIPPNISEFYVGLTPDEESLLFKSLKQYWATEDASVFDELKTKNANLHKKITVLRTWLTEQHGKLDAEVKTFLNEVKSVVYEQANCYLF